MVDLGDGKPEGCEPALLMQHRDEVALHVTQFALGHADLVGALARHDDTRGIFRVFVEADEVGGHAPHRPHEEIMQRQVNQQRDDAGDQERDDQHVTREAVHRLAQRRLVDHNLDELGRARALPTTRMAWLSLLEHVSKASWIAAHTVMLRVSTSWSIFGGRSSRSPAGGAAGPS